MDFGLTEEQAELAGLTRKILAERDAPWGDLAGRIERAHRAALILTFGGGTNEVQRDLIAVFGLKMPRSL